MSTNEEIIINAILAGTREYLANSQRVVAGNEEIAASTAMVGRSMAGTTRRSYLMNQAIFTTRRLMYGLTLGLVGGGIAAAKWGFDFNETMTSARISLERMLPSSQAVNDELDYLFKLAKYSPFTFGDTTLAFRNMFMGMRTLGIDASTVNQTMQSIVDTLSAGGRSTPASLNRVSYALQHMAFLGRLTGQVVNQLGRDGIPAAAILREEFHLTGEEIHNVGKLGIPTLAFLKAFNHYAQNNPVISGAAQRQSMRSFRGLFAQFKDSMSQIMGAVEKGFFNRSVEGLQRVNAFFNRTADVVHNSASATAVIRAIGGDNAVLIWLRIVDALRQFWILFSTVTSSVARSHVFWASVYAVLVSTSIVLHLINPFLQAFGGLLVGLLIPALITWYTVTKVAAFWTGVLALEEVLATKATKELTFFQFLAAVATGRYALAQKLATFWTAAANFGMRAYVFTLALVTWGLRQEMFAAVAAWAATLGPITLILVGLAAIAASIYLIIRYWKELKSVTSGTWLRDKLGISEGAGGGGQYKGGGILGNWLSNKGVPTWLTGAHRMPGMALGGTVSRGGLSWVGERGPELLSLPVGASVLPAHEAFNMQESWMGHGDGIRTIIVKAMIGERVLAEAVADLQAADEARS